MLKSNIFLNCFKNLKIWFEIFFPRWYVIKTVTLNVVHHRLCKEAGPLIGLLILHLFLELDCQCLRKCMVVTSKIINNLLIVPIYSTLPKNNMSKKCGGALGSQWNSVKINNRHLLQLKKKIKILGAVLELPACKTALPIQPIYRKNGPNGRNWQYSLAGSSKTALRVLIF